MFIVISWGILRVGHRIQAEHVVGPKLSPLFSIILFSVEGMPSGCSHQITQSLVFLVGPKFAMDLDTVGPKSWVPKPLSNKFTNARTKVPGIFRRL